MKEPMFKVGDRVLFHGEPAVIRGVYDEMPTKSAGKRDLLWYSVLIGNLAYAVSDQVARDGALKRIED